MLVKFESKSSAAKCIAFHPKRARVLVALKTSFIQLWDYRMGTLVHRFDGHTGVVRCVDFHPTQNMFVSCGDDGTVRVWSLATNECLFVLDKHFDYVRTAFFHPELPWIISASDDQTIRIWNWQNRQEIACLSGHSHWVTCAQFHPTEDLIVSSSMDMTVRVWDMSALRKAHSAPGAAGGEIPSNDDMFGALCVVKYVLEGHDRGVYWAAFHPTQPLVVSGSEDRTLKVWRYAETRAWELDTCRGHTNGVTSCLFHGDYIVSCGDDKTVRSWDLNSRALLSTTKSSDRFWNVAVHPNMNLLGAAHDSGVMVFKLTRERPASAISGDKIFYVTPAKTLKEFDPKDPVDRQGILTLKNVGQSRNPVIDISYNPAERAILATSKAENGNIVYALAKLPAQPMGPVEPTGVVEGSGDNAVFISRNRFAVFNSAKQMVDIKDLQNSTTKSISLPIVTKRVVSSPTPNTLLLLGGASVVLFDTQQNKVLHKIAVSNVKYVAWSPNGKHIALQSKHNITIANAQLEQLSVVHEVIRIKSVCWDSHGLIFYTTFNHLKYALMNGDSGVLKSLSQTLYVQTVNNSTIVCLNRAGQAHIIRVDPTEYRFKKALVDGNFGQVARLIRDSNLVGQSIIAYLQKRGYPEVAMQFVQEPQTKFDLAIECGDLNVAYEQARILNKPVADRILGVAAMEQGNHDIVEDMYQKQAEFDKLSFLYLITGNKPRLEKMEQIAEHRNDANSRFQVSLFLNSVESRINLMRDSGLFPLAYALAKSNGLNHLASEILAESGLDASQVDVPVKDVAGQPRLGVAHETYKQTWPIHHQDLTKIVLEAEVDESQQSRDVEETTEAVQGMSLDDDDEPEEDGDGWDLVIDEGDADEADDTTDAVAAAATKETDLWMQSPIAAHHIAAGSFESAAQLLNRQIGVFNFAPLKPRFMQVYQASKLYLTGHEGLAPLEFYARLDAKVPLVPGFDALSLQLKEGYKLVKANKIDLVVECFRDILYTVVTLSVSGAEIEKCSEIIEICKNYILAFTIELKRRSLGPDDIKGNLALASYFTVPELRPLHRTLQYQVAFMQHYNAKNFATASHYAQKYLDVAPDGAGAAKIRKLKAKCDASPLDEVDIGFDAFAECDICPGTLTPIYAGQPFVQDPLTGAKYHPTEKGKICALTTITQVGAAASGLHIKRA